MQTRRDVLTAIGTGIAIGAAGETAGAAAAAAHSSHAFSFDDAHAVRGASLPTGVREAFDDRIAAAVDAVDLDPGDVTAVGRSAGATAVTGDFRAIELRFPLILDGYSRTDSHAGYTVYETDDGDPGAVAIADEELFVASDTDRLRKAIDAATTAAADGDDAVAALLLALDGDVIRGRTVGPGDGGVAGHDAAAVARTFDGETVTERRAFAFDRPGAVPLPAVENHVAETTPDDRTFRVDERHGCAVATATFDAKKLRAVRGSL